MLKSEAVHRNFSVVGNILGSAKHAGGRCDSYGQPNIGNGESGGTAQPSTGDYWDDWRPTTGTTIRGTLTARTDDFHGGITLSSGKLISGTIPSNLAGGGYCTVHMGKGRSVRQRVVAVDSSPWQVKLPPLNTPVRIEPGSGGYQELDLDVEATTLKKANAYMPVGIPSAESLGGTALPPSLYLLAKPIWFGHLSWPPFDPGAPNLNYEAIPAGYRFMRGVDPPGTGASAPQMPTSLKSFVDAKHSVYLAILTASGDKRIRGAVAAGGARRVQDQQWLSACRGSAPLHAPYAVP